MSPESLVFMVFTLSVCLGGFVISLYIHGRERK